MTFAIRRYEVSYPSAVKRPTRHLSFLAARRAARRVRGCRIIDRRRRCAILARPGWIERKPFTDAGV